MSNTTISFQAPSPVVGEGGGEGASLRSELKSAWRTFRTLVGDDAYEKYCEHHACHHANEPVLDRHAFYVNSQQKKWTGINRCC